MLEAAVRVVVTGLVQGVYFRQSTKDMALRIGVYGWVRNLPDGSVEAWFEGPGSSVERAVEWCLHGPSRASVSAVEKTHQQARGFPSFEIR